MGLKMLDMTVVVVKKYTTIINENAQIVYIDINETNKKKKKK